MQLSLLAAVSATVSVERLMSPHCLFLSALAICYCIPHLHKCCYCICKQSYQCCCHPIIYHSISLPYFMLIWLDHNITTCFYVLLYSLHFWTTCPCLLNIHCQFVLGCYLQSLLSIHQLFCYCMCLVPQALYCHVMWHMYLLTHSACCLLGVYSSSWAHHVGNL